MSYVARSRLTGLGNVAPYAFPPHRCSRTLPCTGLPVVVISPSISSTDDWWRIFDPRSVSVCYGNSHRNKKFSEMRRCSAPSDLISTCGFSPSGAPRFAARRSSTPSSMGTPPPKPMRHARRWSRCCRLKAVRSCASPTSLFMQRACFLSPNADVIYTC